MGQLGCSQYLTLVKPVVLYTWYSRYSKGDDRRQYTFETPKPSKDILIRSFNHYIVKHGTPEAIGIREEDHREWMAPGIIYTKPPKGHFYIMGRGALTLEQKALLLIDSGKIEQVDDETWKVPSLTVPDKYYTVKWYGSGGSGECTGFTFRQWCCHIEAVKRIAPKREKKEKPILDEL